MAKKSYNPIPPTMDEVMAYLQTQSGPVTKKELNRAFGSHGDNRANIKKMIRDMREKGLVHTERRGKRIILADRLPERVVVEVTGIDSMGDLMARPLEWLSDMPAPQIIITKDKLSPAAGIGDVVQVETKSIGNRTYHAKTIRRVTAGENHMIGVYENGKVYSVDRRLKQAFTLAGLPHTHTLKNRDLVVVEIPLIRVKNPQAMFVKRIGAADEPFAATLVSIYLHNLPVAFTEQAEKQANRATVPPMDAGRQDLRAVPFVTIDGADARDFDDAVWAEPDTAADNKGGWHIMVGIADVSWYVRPETALDMDARLRGNSVYFPDRVLPMLPEALSNGVCSLKPNEPRAALVCEVWINANGYKIKHKFYRAMIQSARRLTYDEVQAAMDGQTPIVGLEKEIDSLVGAYKSLQINRQKRGVLEIDVPEKQVILDQKGRVQKIQLRQQLPSMQLIEELMILANVSAAEILEEKGSPVMYRVHDRPSAEKTESLLTALSTLAPGSKLSQTTTAAEFNDILAHNRVKPYEKTINELVLRSQSQAAYSPDNIGHFGLALTRYAHFTSPIRRYADILVHRSLVKALKLGEGALTPAETNTFEDTAHHISATERQAATAELDAVDRYIALYMQDKVGKSFNARITSVTPFGAFIAIEPSGAEGFIPMRGLTGDYYDYEESFQRLVGRSTGSVYALGDKIRVVLKECVTITGGLTFAVLRSDKRQHQPHAKTKIIYRKRNPNASADHENDGKAGDT